MALAKSLNLKVIAEGVETDIRCAILREHGCEFMQGFLFSHPVPAEEMTRLLSNRRPALVFDVLVRHHHHVTRRNENKAAVHRRKDREAAVQVEQGHAGEEQEKRRSR